MGGCHEKGQFVKEGHREEKRKALGEKRKEEGKSKMTVGLGALLCLRALAEHLNPHAKLQKRD